jgi:hypothetical protein
MAARRFARHETAGISARPKRRPTALAEKSGDPNGKGVGNPIETSGDRGPYRHFQSEPRPKNTPTRPGVHGSKGTEGTFSAGSGAPFAMSARRHLTARDARHPTRKITLTWVPIPFPWERATRRRSARMTPTGVIRPTAYPHPSQGVEHYSPIGLIKSNAQPRPRSMARAGLVRDNGRRPWRGVVVVEPGTQLEARESREKGHCRRAPRIASRHEVVLGSWCRG